MTWGTHVYNPRGVEVSELPTIYGFTNAIDVRQDGVVVGADGQIVAEDGTEFAGHYSSTEDFLKRDLGILTGAREDRHREFAAHYSDGYRMEFVRYNEVMKHEGLLQAIRNSGTLIGKFEFAEAKDRRKGF